MKMSNEDNEPLRMFGSHTHVMPLMETKHDLENTSTQLKHAAKITQLALSASNIGIWSWHIHDNSLAWNEGMFALYRLDKNLFTGHYPDWSKHVHPDDINETEKHIQDCIEKQNKLDTVFRIVWPDGDIRYIHASAQLHYDEQGNPLHMLGANWDVTKEKRHELTLEHANTELETFTYAASHDLKSPLRSIKQLASWIEQDLKAPPQDVMDNLGLMEKRISRMENLLDGLLVYSRLESEQTEPIQENIDARKVIEDIFEFSSPPKTFKLCLFGEFPKLNSPKAPFEQVLRNLINNAIKHRPNDDGEVLVWVCEESNHFRFHIGDKGRSIPEKHRERIFEMFQTLKPKDEVEGNGMGLTIAKKIVRNHQGSIGLRCHNAESTGYVQAHKCNNEFFFTWPKS